MPILVPQIGEPSHTTARLEEEFCCYSNILRESWSKFAQRIMHGELEVGLPPMGGGVGRGCSVTIIEVPGCESKSTMA